MALGGTLAPTVTSVISTYSTAVKWEGITQTYNKTLAETTESVAHTTNLKAIIEGIDETAADGETVKVGDLKVLFSGQGLKNTPKAGDRLTILDDEYEVTTVTPTIVTGVILTWQVIARR